MAYFSNGSEGECFDEQCAQCRGWDRGCPVAMAQMHFNYDAVNNKVATDILNMLVKNDGTCNVFECFKQHLELTEDEKNQLNLFEGC